LSSEDCQTKAFWTARQQCERLVEVRKDLTADVHLSIRQISQSWKTHWNGLNADREDDGGLFQIVRTLRIPQAEHSLSTIGSSSAKSASPATI
jgi:hypothetical protein